MTNLREERLKKGMNQRELAEKSHICQTLISDLEREVRKPWPAAIKRLSKVLGIPAENLFPSSKEDQR